MASPPPYTQLHEEQDVEAAIQQVRLALVVPDERSMAPITNSSSSQHETNEQSSHDDRPPTPTENDKFPDEAPPPYQTDSDLPPYPPDYQEQLQASLEEKLIRVGLLNESEFRNDENRLGGDIVFILAFIIAFIFNWIGFLFAYCLSITVAGRYGALAGFGASMVKWSLIAMYSDCCTPYMQSAVCLLAALIFCGILIFFRGIFLYMKAKAYFYSGRNGNIRFVYWRPE
ncbi:putative NEDD4 family-interacting protein 1 isoform X2 [Apostichopus japonicus]|uniref:Putative NEDD4 family-interacting protein 1 isoform X2 n=1 Tax=Stichopus japonicus TaxID=307972 RepID=A0A2G8LK36_STIJA|nr:putative NEDD4 family-interacting protein 1 isoform X2 [Apostichopus japonicus]